MLDIIWWTPKLCLKPDFSLKPHFYHVHPTPTRSPNLFLFSVLYLNITCVSRPPPPPHLICHQVLFILFPSSVQFSSVTQSCPTLCNPMDCSTPGLPVHHQLPEFTQTHVHWVGDTIHPSILCHPFLLVPLIFPSIRVFSNESVLCIRWPKYWTFGFNISPSNEYSGLVSFRMEWLDVLAVQETLLSLLQHHISKTSILQHSAFFVVQLSHPHMTTGKTIALTRWTFVGKVMSLLFNMLSRLVITFLPISKHL